jgi:hypothetical protein
MNFKRQRFPASGLFGHTLSPMGGCKKLKKDSDANNGIE